MKKKPQWLRKLGQVTNIIADRSSDLYKDARSKAGNYASQLDKEYDISNAVKQAGESAKETLLEVEKEYSISDKASAAKDVLVKSGAKISQATKDSGALNVIDKARSRLQSNVYSPISLYINESGFGAQLDDLLQKTEVVYGDVRSIVKPYYAPETPTELLENTKEELIYINSCILQISTGEAEKLADKFGSAVVSKVAGAASVGVLFSMVSAFGTAGTGTAISGLSGAAASNATLAWVGGLLGGGMATGAVLTGGLALAVGVGVYKLVGSEARQFEHLSEQEQRIIESTGFLIAAINDLLKKPEIHLDAEEAQMLLNNTLLPLYQSLQDESESITRNLDGKHSLFYRRHALKDFKRRVIDGFEYFINEAKKSSHVYPEFVIAGVIYALLSRTAIDGSNESQIALDALRRMKNDWQHATEAQLSEAISEYEPEQLKGIANNVKGIYHELLFVDNYNKQNTDTYAVLFEETNHPGADVQIRSVIDDMVLREFQLKSTDSANYVNEHVDRYSEIDVLVTEEVSANSETFDSSGISNDDITGHIDQVITQIGSNTMMDKTFDSMAFASLAAAGKQTIDILNGRQDVSEAGAEVAKSALVASGSTLIASYLFT